MKGQNFYGTLTAMVTPLLEGNVDWHSLKSFTRWQIEQGIQGLVAVGTTGESPTLDHSEHMDVVAAVMEEAAGRVPVIAGAGSNSTREAISLTKRAHDLGVDGMLHVTPYYNKPSQEGLFNHFSAIAECTDKPIVLYSIPGRCVIEIGIPLLERLRAKYPHVNVIKESGGSCERVSQIRRALGDDMTILSGEDSLTLPYMSLGASGVISVASNLFPAAVVSMVQSALDNDLKGAQAMHEKLYSLFIDLFCEPNPVPVKAMMKRAGIITSDQVRRPLCSLLPENYSKLERVVQQLEEVLAS